MRLRGWPWVRALDRARPLLDDHLAHEEREAIPLMQRYVTPEEDERIEREHFRAGVPLRRVLEVVPWVLHELPPGARDRVLDLTGPAYRGMWLSPAAGSRDATGGRCVMSDRMRLLFTASPAYGHLLPLLPMLRAATTAGHDVRLATGPDMVGPMRARRCPRMASARPGTRSSPSATRRPLAPTPRTSTPNAWSRPACCSGARRPGGCRACWTWPAAGDRTSSCTSRSSSAASCSPGTSDCPTSRTGTARCP